MIRLKILLFLIFLFSFFGYSHSNKVELYNLNNDFKKEIEYLVEIPEIFLR